MTADKASWRVSVVVPTRKRPELLRECLQSIRSLEGPDLEIEILVGDNGPDDETRAVTDEFGGLYSAVEVRGSASTRNAGMKAATGDFIAFSDDDDVWTSEHLRSHLRLLDARPELMAVFGQIQSTDWELNPLGGPWPQTLPDDGDLLMSVMNFFPQLGGTVVRASVRDTVGLMDVTLVGDSDWDWHIRIAKTHPVGFVPVPCVLFRQRPEGSADALIHSRIPHTRRIFFRHALPIWRDWSSPIEFLRAYNRAMDPYFIYFAETAVRRMRERDRAGAVRALYDAARLNPFQTVKQFAQPSPLRNAVRDSLFSKGR